VFKGETEGIILTPHLSQQRCSLIHKDHAKNDCWLVARRRIGTPSNDVALRLSHRFLIGEIMTEVLVLRKIFSTKPQQFMLVLQDPMKVQNTEFGAEGKVRTILKAVGISQPDIEKLFEKAKSNT
jgi:hypothetical protein